MLGEGWGPSAQPGVAGPAPPNRGVDVGAQG